MEIKTLQEAATLVSIANSVFRLEQLIEENAKTWSIKHLNGSMLSIDLHEMLNLLPESEIIEINSFIMNRFRRHVREGRKKLDDLETVET